MRISDWSSDVCSSDLGAAHVAQLQARNDAQQARLDDTRREAQREVNALAARMGELQAEANRLNALGERLTRIGQLGDGEFDFDKRSEEHTSELQSLMRISYAVFCLKKKKNNHEN